MHMLTSFQDATGDHGPAEVREVEEVVSAASNDLVDFMVQLATDAVDAEPQGSLSELPVVERPLGVLRERGCGISVILSRREKS